MSSKLMIAVGVLAAIVAITALKYNSEESADLASLSTGLPSLAVDTEHVTSLQIRTPDKGAVTLSKLDGKWRVTEPIAADASQEAVDTALEKLRDLTVSSVAATNAKNHARLEVSEEKAVAVVARAGEEELADMRIGSYRSGNTMVRRAGDDDVFAVEGSIRFAFDKELKDFRNRTITELDIAQVLGARFDNDKGQLALTRDGDDFKLSEGQKPIENFDPKKAKAAITAAVRMAAADFAAADVSPVDAGLGDNAATLTLELASDAGENLVILKVGKKIADKYSLSRVGDDVIYLVSTFVGDQLLSGRSDFIADPPPKSTPPGQP